VSPSPPVLSSEVVKALTSEIISDRPMSAAPSPMSHSATATSTLIKPSREVSSGTKKPIASAASATQSKRLSDEATTKAPRKKTDPSSLVSSRGSNQTEIEGGSELDSFLRRKKESSSGGSGVGAKKTGR
jgi:hypothetical protein